MMSWAVPVTMGKGALVTVAKEWQWSMAANVMASKDREVNLILILILINSVCVSITAVVTSMQAIIRGMHVNIPYGHALFPDSDDNVF